MYIIVLYPVSTYSVEETTHYVLRNTILVTSKHIDRSKVFKTRGRVCEACNLTCEDISVH